jgi:hypothetical protein
MSSKPPAGINFSPEDNVTKIIYNVVDTLKDVITVDSDRYRLSFCINMFLKKEITTLENAIEQADTRSSSLNNKELEQKLTPLLKEKGIL